MSQSLLNSSRFPNFPRWSVTVPAMSLYVASSDVIESSPAIVEEGVTAAVAATVSDSQNEMLPAIVGEGVTAAVAASVSESQPTTEAQNLAVIALMFDSSSLPTLFSKHQKQAKAWLLEHAGIVQSECVELKNVVVLNDG